jgi:hypothetical protein
MHTQMARLIAGIEAGQRVGIDDDAPAFLHLLDIDHPPGKGDRPEMALQHRRLALPGGFPHQREAGRQSGECQRRFAPSRLPAQRQGKADPGERRRDGGPQRGLDRERKIGPDPGAEKYRQPQEAAALLGGEAIGERAKNRKAWFEDRTDPSARDYRVRHRRPAARAKRA